MSIRRSPRRNHYVIINQSVFDDERLDHKALGILTYLLSKPDNWRTNSHQLANRFHCNVTTVKGILSGLESIGYLCREKYRNSDGTFYWESTVFEVPTMVQKTSDGKTSDGKTSDGKLAHITNNEVTITELTKKDHHEADADFLKNGKPEDPFFTGQARQIAREVAKVTRQQNGTRDFLADAPWGKLASELSQKPDAVWDAWQNYLLSLHSQKKDPIAYVGKICREIYQNPGSELNCKAWIEFSSFFKKNLSAPPPPKKRSRPQPVIPALPDHAPPGAIKAARKAFEEARHG